MYDSSRSFESPAILYAFCLVRYQKWACLVAPNTLSLCNVMQLQWRNQAHTACLCIFSDRLCGGAGACHLRIAKLRSHAKLYWSLRLHDSCKTRASEIHEIGICAIHEFGFYAVNTMFYSMIHKFMPCINSCSIQFHKESGTSFYHAAFSTATQKVWPWYRFLIIWKIALLQICCCSQKLCPSHELWYHEFM